MDALVKVAALKKHFPLREGFFGRSRKSVHAVDDVSLTINLGETLGLVGESGCGKTTLGRLVVRLIEPTSGNVEFNGQQLFELSKKELKKLRKEMQIIFQDPFSSLDPRILVRDIIGEPMKINDVAKGKEADQRVLEMLEKVQLMPEHMHRYPHEFSGGQRQRIVIARALGLEPKFIVLDEPTSSLDVSVQAQILNLLIDLQKEFQLTYLFITHNLEVVKHMSDRVAVMYLGKIIELAPTDRLYRSPRHPYTQALLSANPTLDPSAKRQLILLKGEPPTPISPPPGCRFRERCAYSIDKCVESPSLVEISSDHFVACHLVD